MFGQLVSWFVMEKFLYNETATEMNMLCLAVMLELAKHWQMDLFENTKKKLEQIFLALSCYGARNVFGNGMVGGHIILPFIIS